MKIVIIGAGSVAFTPAILSGFGVDPRYKNATIGLVDVDVEALRWIEKLALRISTELNMNWTIQGSIERRDVLPGADIVTTAIGVGGIKAWKVDVDLPYEYGFIQPVGDTSGPGGLSRALRHIPVMVAIGKDMENLCPDATLYNFTNPLTVLTQAVNKLTNINCIGLCIGVDLTWDHLCNVVGIDKSRTSIVAGGINHLHWILDFRIDGKPGYPVFSAQLDEMDASPEKMKAISLKERYESKGWRYVCTALYRLLGYFPGPFDSHVIEFCPQFLPGLSSEYNLEEAQGEAIKHVETSYPALWEKMKAIAENKEPIDADSFAKEMAWEHTQLLDVIASQQDDLGETFFINIPNKGMIDNLPADVVVEIPAVVDAAGIHPFALGDLPHTVLPMIALKVASLDLIIEAAMEGSREKAIQAMLLDPYATDFEKTIQMVNALIDAQLEYLPYFQ
jgi:alpha-galactosidase